MRLHALAHVQQQNTGECHQNAIRKIAEMHYVCVYILVQGVQPNCSETVK